MYKQGEVYGTVDTRTGIVTVKSRSGQTVTFHKDDDEAILQFAVLDALDSIAMEIEAEQKLKLKIEEEQQLLNGQRKALRIKQRELETQRKALLIQIKAIDK